LPSVSRTLITCIGFPPLQPRYLYAQAVPIDHISQAYVGQADGLESGCLTIFLNAFSRELTVGCDH